MQFRTKPLIYLIAVLIFLFAAYLISSLYPGIHPLSRTRFSINRQQAEEKALAYLGSQIPAGDRDSQVEFIIENEVTEAARQPVLEDLHEHGLQPFRYWEFAYINKHDKSVNLNIRGENVNETRDLTGNWYIIHISPEGRLLKLDFSQPRLSRLTDSLGRGADRETDRESALAGARNFLAPLVNRPSGLHLTEEKTGRDSLINTIQFKFSEEVGRQKIYHNLKLAHDEVLSYELTFSPPPELKNDGGFTNSAGVIFSILEGIVFAALIILMFYYYTVFLRRESVSFKIALRLVFFIAGITLLQTLLMLWGSADWIALVGGIFSMLFTGLGILLLYTIDDSLARQQWPEKVRIFDAFFRGRFISRHSGRALLAGLFLGTVSLGWYVAVLYISDRFLNQPLSLGENLNYSYLLIFPVLWYVLHFTSNAFFHELFFRMFGLSVLKRWFRQTGWILLLGMLPGLFFSQELSTSNVWLRLLAQAGPAFLFTLFFIRYDIFTTVVGYFTFLLFSKAVVFYHTGTSFFQGMGSGLYFILTLLAAIGIVSVVLKRNEKEEQTRFIPEYLRKLEEKERLMRELEIAHTIQQKFLPTSTPGLEGYRIAASCQPAYEVGGDYFDYLPLDENRLGIVIGDVSNKGISAAFFMTLVKGYLKALTAHYDRPADILCETNRLFYQEVEAGYFISMIFGILNRQTAEFTFSRAGHNPLLHLTGRAGESQWKTPPGVGIGILPDQKFREIIREEKISLNTGDMIVLYTDGYTEAMNDRQQEFEEERFKALVEKNKEKSPEALIAVIENAILTWQGKQPAMDDRTLVVIKREA